MRILLADDNETNRLLARTILREEGFTVDEALTGTEAVDAARERAYDLILMDVSMPDMDGLTATRTIRQFTGKAGSVPILAMTAHAMPGDRERCLAAGMDDHIPKPLNRAGLLASVGRWLAARPKPVNYGDGAAGASQGPLDEAAFTRLTGDLGGALLPDLIGSFIAESRARGIKVVRAANEGWLETLEAEAQALADVADTFGARHLRHCAGKIADAARAGEGETARILAASVNQLTDEAVETMMTRLSG
jgi:two-component system sensor histidine kinase/response regulator